MKWDRWKLLETTVEIFVEKYSESCRCDGKPSCGTVLPQPRWMPGLRWAVGNYLAALPKMQGRDVPRKKNWNYRDGGDCECFEGHY